MQETDMRFGFDSRAQRMAAVLLALLFAIPVMILGSASMITWQALTFLVKVPFLFAHSLLVSTGQMFLNIGWFVSRMVKENM